MGKYICQICGKEFDRVGNGKYCPGPHYRECVICGKEFEYSKPSDPRTCCSRQCSNELSRLSKSKTIRKCKECGKLFHSSSGTQLYCEGPHFTTCKVCHRSFSYACSPNEKPTYCSKECREIGKRNTVFIRYGVNNVSESPEVRNKISSANSSEEVRNKRQQTCLIRYGFTHICQRPDVKAKLAEKMNSDDYIQKYTNTCLSRFGVDSPMKSAEIVERRRQTCLDKYGSIGHPWTEDEYKAKMIDPSKFDNYWSFKQDPETFIKSNYQCSPAITQLEIDLGVTDTPIYDILVANNCSDLIAHASSNMEVDVYNFLRSMIPNATIVQNDRHVISPKEIDIYLPDYSLGIECNPAATHNSSSADPWGAPPKSYKYHKDKSVSAASRGIFLFHIFGYEWINKRPIVESMLRNLVSANTQSVGARNTHVVELSYQECKAFLDANHRQGNVSASVRLGLRDNVTNELLSVMTFGHVRNTIGYTNTTEKSDWELSRFCTKLNTNVSGGASKLFKYFVSTYNFNKIVSFSDVAHTRGKLYSKLGFVEITQSDPSYVWTNIYDTVYYNRVSCQKKNLRKLLKDNTIDIETKSESQIMKEHGFVKLFDSGTIRWEYSNN